MRKLRHEKGVTFIQPGIGAAVLPRVENKKWV